MTFGIPKSLFLLISGTAMVLCGCTTTSGPVTISKVNPYHLKSNVIVQTDARMVEFENRRHLWGAVDYAEQKLLFGYYYSIFWSSKDRNPALVRLDYRATSTGSTILTKELAVSKPKRNNVTKFQVIGDEYEVGGAVTQWKASIIENGTVVAEYKSYLWKE